MFGLREFLSRANTDSEKDVSSSPLAPVAASSFPDFGASSEDNRDDTHNDNEKILRNLGELLIRNGSRFSGCGSPTRGD